MYIKVHVTAGAKKEKWEKESNTVFTAHVREKAERNNANKRVQQLVAEYFDISVRAVRLLSGHRSPSKIFTVDKEE